MVNKKPGYAGKRPSALVAETLDPGREQDRRLLGRDQHLLVSAGVDPFQKLVRAKDGPRMRRADGAQPFGQQVQVVGVHRLEIPGLGEEVFSVDALEVFLWQPGQFHHRGDGHVRVLAGEQSRTVGRELGHASPSDQCDLQAQAQHVADAERGRAEHFGDDGQKLGNLGSAVTMGVALAGEFFWCIAATLGASG